MKNEYVNINYKIISDFIEDLEKKQKELNAEINSFVSILNMWCIQNKKR